MEVTNNSYYIDPYALWCKANLDEKAAILAVERALKYSEKKDVVNVAAAGNSAWDLSKPITDTGSPNNTPEPTPRDTDQRCYDMPTEVGNTVTISSVGPTAVKSYYSNWGRNVVDVTAPGGDSRVAAATPDKNGRILSTVVGGGWGYKQGTSMASPHAAGVVALIRGTDTGLNAKQAHEDPRARGRHPGLPRVLRRQPRRRQRRHLRGRRQGLRLLRLRSRSTPWTPSPSDARPEALNRTCATCATCADHEARVPSLGGTGLVRAVLRSAEVRPASRRSRRRW